MSIKSHNFLIPSFLLKEENPYSKYMYVTLQSMFRYGSEQEMLVNASMLCWKIYGDIKTHRKEISEGLCVLEEYGVVKTYNSEYYLINKDVFTMGKGVQFFVVLQSDYKIFSEYKRNNKIRLFEFYLNLLTTFDFNIKVEERNSIFGHYPISNMVAKFGSNKNTISSYMNTLEEMGILFIIKGKYNGLTCHFESSWYCHDEDKDLLRKYVVDNNISIRDNPDINFRKISQLYNNYVKGIKVNCEDLYADCVAYNNEMDRLYKLTGNYNLIERKKDLSVFTTNEN